MTWEEVRDKRVNYWKPRASKDDRYMTLNIATWHMSVFPEFHKDIEEIKEKLRLEKKDPMGYSYVKEVYDLVEQRYIEVKL